MGTVIVTVLEEILRLKMKPLLELVKHEND